MRGLVNRFLFPLLFAIIAFTLIVLFYPFSYNSPYNLKLIEDNNSMNLYQYYDMDNDGESELLHVGYDAAGDYSYPYVRLRKGIGSNSLILEQINLKNPKLTRKATTMIDDFDSNGLAEFYTFTVKDSTLYLEGFEYNHDLEKIKMSLYREIVPINIHKSNFDVNIFNDAEFIDLNNDGFKECIFIVGGLYTAEPRGVFAYDIKNDSLWYSNTGSISLRWLRAMEHNNKTYFSAYSVAHHNTKEPFPKYHDQCGWAFILDENMKLQFEPIPNQIGYYYHVQNYPVIFNNNICLISFFEVPVNSKEQCEIRIYNLEGNMVSNKKLDVKGGLGLSLVNLHKGLFYLTAKSEGVSWECSISDKINLSKLSSSKLLLLQENEFFQLTWKMKNYQLGINPTSLTLFSEKLAPLAELSIPKIIGYSTFSYGEIDNRLYLAFSNFFKTTFFEIVPNNLYSFRYLFWGSIFLFLLMLFLFMQFIFNFQLQKQQRIKEELTRNQLTISKNQLEPHFMLNTLNYIGYMFSNENKEEAQYYFGKYASLLRRGLIYADQVETTLKEELLFIKDYLVLQKRRLNEELEFNIEADDDVELSEINIPHSLVYTFVENAIKHGLVPKEGNRILQVHVSKQLSSIEILIKDNGIGRKQSQVIGTSGTGKGMEIVKTIIHSYNKIYKQRITYKIKDLMNKEGLAIGTEVRVKL